jgi:hypothetical protein
LAFVRREGWFHLLNDLHAERDNLRITAKLLLLVPESAALMRIETLVGYKGAHLPLPASLLDCLAAANQTPVNV